MSRAITRSDCFHHKGTNGPCHASNIPYMSVFGFVQIILSQIPEFGELWFLSVLAAVMSFLYSTIGLGLGIAKAVGKNCKPFNKSIFISILNLDHCVNFTNI